MEPQKYRIKPTVTVEAVQIQSEPVNAEELVPNPDDPEAFMYAPPPDELLEIAKWINSQVTTGGDRIHELEVPTKMGSSYARTGDWVVKVGNSGYFEVLDDKTFREIYEQVGQ